MGEETIKKVLKDFGLTETEAEIYLFLAKHDAQKGTEISRQIKKDKGQVYQILRTLQTKGLVESTFEAPIRFTPVPFETVIESTIKAKREEAARIESAKKELLSYWNKINKTRLELPSEKFTVIEGRNKVYSKISQMITETKNQLSTITTVTSLLRADQLGLYDSARKQPSKSPIEFRFLTELSASDLNGIKMILRTMARRGFDFRGRNPILGQKLSPRMVIRDDEETLFFITPRTISSANEQDDLCLWTNCKDLVQALTVVFEDFWRNSTDLNEKIQEIETGKPCPQTKVMTDGETGKKTYDEILEKARNNIVFITSAEGLIGLSRENLLLNKWAMNGVCVQIMAPIVNENLKAAKQLCECCLVRHTPASYMNTTLVDDQHLFQFKNKPSPQNEANKLSFQNAFYTSDSDYVGRTRNMLNDVWKNSRELSDVTVVSLKEFLSPPPPPLPRKNSEYTKMMGWIDYPKLGMVSEAEILDRMRNAQRIPAKDPLKDVVRYYGSRGIGIIHPPENFNLSDMIIIAFHWNEQSSFGVENRLMISMKVDGPKGHSFLPVASVGDNPDAMSFLNGTQRGTPSEKSQLVQRDELQVKLQGNTLFAGWTVPIPLHIRDQVIPPACLLIEAYGQTKTALRKSMSPSGRMQVSMFTLSESSLTFFHHSSKYAGPGTDAFLHKNVVSTTYPPIVQQDKS